METYNYKNNNKTTEIKMKITKIPFVLLDLNIYYSFICLFIYIFIFCNNNHNSNRTILTVK